MPLKLTPAVRCTTMVTAGADRGTALVTRTSSSLNHGLLLTTTPLAVTGNGVGVGVSPQAHGVIVGEVEAEGVGVAGVPPSAVSTAPYAGLGSMLASKVSAAAWPGNG